MKLRNVSAGETVPKERCHLFSRGRFTGWAVLGSLLALASIPLRAASDIHCTPAQFWSPGFGAPPGIPFVRDVDGDGYADLVSLTLAGDVGIEVSLNAAGQKPCFPKPAVDDFGRNARGGTVGTFTGGKGADVLILLADGTIRLAWNFNASENKYERAQPVGALPSTETNTVLMAGGKVAADGREQAMILATNGNAWLVSLSPETNPKAVVTALGAMEQHVSAMALAELGRQGGGTLLYERADGWIMKRPISARGLGSPSHVMKTKAGTPLLIANLGGHGKRDLVLGAQIFWDASPWRMSRWKELDTSSPGILLAGDVNRHGRDDLIRFMRVAQNPEPYTENDVFLHTTYQESDPDWDFDGLTNEEEAKLGTDPCNRDTDNDGLLDGWEVNGFHGFDLAKLGCSPLHKDVICEIKRFDSVKQADMDKTIASLKRFYADLPITNADGKGGIHFIALQPPPLTKDQSDGKDWGAINDQYCPPAHHGIMHWMSVTPGDGGGQSSQMGDAGGCADGWAVFAHEFGHQLGLDHEGFWPVSHCPIYTSLMNYCYSYSFDGRAEAVHYSNGKFKALVLNEHDLSETLPYKFSDVEFLSQAPYHFRLKPNGQTTLIDWNWNGVLGEQHVKADINYGYSTSAGFRNAMDPTFTTPCLVTPQTNELLMVYGKDPSAAAPGAKYVATPTDSHAAPATVAPGDEGNKHNLSLVLRHFLGAGQWAEPTVLETNGVTGDPTAVFDGRRLWVFYPRAEGICYQQLAKAADHWQPGPRETLPESQNTQVTPCLFHDRLYVFLRRETGPVQAIYKTASGWSQPQSLGFASTIPVGATVDPIKNELLIGCAQDQDEHRKSRWQIRRMVPRADGTLAASSWQWVEGEHGRASGNTRVSLIFSSASDAGPQGKLRLIGGGYIPPNSRDNAAGFYMAEQIPDATVNGGWLVKRYYDEWTNSRSAPSAVAFNGDIALAYRWRGDSPAYRDNQIHMCYAGLGIDDAPMGDFNDVDFISRIGLHRSISQFSVRP